MILRPDGLKALKNVANKVGLARRGADLHRATSFDATHHRQGISHAGMLPNLKENPRHCTTPTRGRQRCFNATIHALRTRVDRTLAWEDQFKRLLRRFEPIHQRHYGRKRLVYTLIKVRACCGA